MVAAPTASRYTPTSVPRARAMEATWLVAAALVPLAMANENWMEGWIQMPKVFVMRTSALVLAALVGFEWALAARGGAPVSEPQVHKRLIRALLLHPARLVFLAAGVVLLSNLISIALSPIPGVSPSSRLTRSARLFCWKRRTRWCRPS